MTSYTLLGVRIDDIALDELHALFLLWLQGEGQHVVVTPNPEFLVLAHRDESFRAFLNASDLALPDGFGLKIFVPITHRMTGIDALTMLDEICKERDLRLVTIGSVPCDIVVGNVHDHLSIDDVQRIAKLQPDVIAVALGQGKQERIIATHQHEWPSAKILIGVGGAVDVLSGIKHRAPKLFRYVGLEWLWRLISEPRRLRRIVNAVIVFPTLVILDRLHHRKNI